MSAYIRRVTRITVLPEDQPIFSEMATHVVIDDEGAGELIEIQQQHRTDSGRISIESREWPAIRSAVEELFADIEQREQEREQEGSK